MPLARPGLMLAIPSVGVHSSHFTQAKDRLAWPTNFTWSQFYIDKREVGRARNMFAWKAMEEHVRYLFFWDEDVIPPVFGLKSLLFQLENHPEWTVATGIYAVKMWPPEPLVYQEWGQGPSYNWRLGEVFPIVFSGLGFTLIRVQDLVNLAPQVEQYEDRNPWSGQPVTVPRFFNTQSSIEISETEQTRLGSTEDAPFYHLLQDSGLIAVADANVMCAHYDSGNNRFYTVPQESLVCRKPDAWAHEPRTVNLGAGGELSPYEINVDLREGTGVFRCDIRRLPDEWADQFDVVHSEHALEHFEYEDTQDILKEWVRIVKPGGQLRVEMPDLQWAAEQIVETGDITTFLQGSLYGDQASEYWEQEPYGGEHNGRFIPYSHANNRHLAGFTAKSLQRLLEGAGLEAVKTERRGFSLYGEGVKPNGKPSV